MNTRELTQFQDWDEKTLVELVGRYVRAFRRIPDYDDLVRFRLARGRLELRMPGQHRRRRIVVTSL